jgi:hypothetical protein
LKRIVVLFIAALLSGAYAYAGQVGPDRPIVFADRQAKDVRVVMYMTTW